MSYEERLDETLEEIRSMLLVKHESYGNDNLKTFGELGVLVRASDKVARLKHLIQSGKSEYATETKTDTWMDLAGYAIQALILFEETVVARSLLEKDISSDEYVELVKKQFPGNFLNVRLT